MTLQSQTNTMLFGFVIAIPIVIIIGSYFVKSELTEDFREFLDDRYGMGSATRFERAELGRSMLGSFGGRKKANQKIVKQV